VLALHNLTASEQEARLEVGGTDRLSGRWITGRSLRLRPYQAVWVRSG